MSGRSPPRAGVCGWPIAHSRSPLIHGYWLKRSASRAPTSGSPCRRRNSPLSPPRSAATASSAPTSPCRTRRPPSPPATGSPRTRERSGAVNTLWREDGRAVRRQHRRRGLPRQSRRRRAGLARAAATAVVLGAGGAARAIVYAPARARRSSAIAIVNRTLDARRGAGRAIRPRDDARRPGASCRSGSTAPTCSSTRRRSAWPGQPPLDIDLEPMKARAVVADIVYIPLRDAADRGGAAARSDGRRGFGHVVASGRARLRALVRRAPDGDAGVARAGRGRHPRRREASARDRRGTDRLDRDGQNDRRARCSRRSARRCSTPTRRCANSIRSPDAEAVEAAFPGVIEGGEVNRDKLAAAALADPQALKRLEAIVHPEVARRRAILSRRGRGARGGASPSSTSRC